MKATPNPYLIEILKDYGCGCDCSSMTELMLSDAIGVRGEDIMFSSNDTPAEEFVYADKLGATIMMVDPWIYSGNHQLPLQSRRRVPDQQRYYGQSRRFQIRHDKGAAF